MWVKLMPFLTLRRLPAYHIHYQVEGRGKPLLLLHPLMGDMSVWKNLNYEHSLKDNFMLIKIDALGHGLSSKPHDIDAYSLEVAADYLAQLLDHLFVDKTHVLGYSMGALFGFALAIHYPNIVDRLVLGGNHPFKRPEGFVDPRIEIFERGLDAVLDWEKPKTKHRRDFLEKQDYNAFATFLKAVNQYDFTEDELARINAPVFLFAGSEDPMLPDIERAFHALPNARMKVVEGLDHDQAFIRRSKIIKDILSFLQV